MLEHDLFNLLEDKLASLKKIEYFTDDWAAQYKNCKNFTKLYRHEEDFSVSVEYFFFATSHGKSAYDGIGGKMVRSIDRLRLKVSDDQ